jgi:hypothetical protein
MDGLKGGWNNPCCRWLVRPGCSSSGVHLIFCSDGVGQCRGPQISRPCSQNHHCQTLDPRLLRAVSQQFTAVPHIGWQARIADVTHWKSSQDLHGLEACRDKIVRVSASHDGSCVVALTSDGHCWLHNCALGQSEAIDLPAADSLPLEFNLKAKKQQLWDVQLEACASTSLISFSWMGPAGNMMMCLPFAVASTASHASRTVVWANHEEQFFPGVTILGSCVCSAAMLSLEGWVTITSSLAAGAGADSSGDSWTLSLSCSLFCIKEGTTASPRALSSLISFAPPHSPMWSATS